MEIGVGFGKSRHCSGGDCVEVGAEYVAASYCGGAENCVEVGAEERTAEIIVKVRDSKDPDGPVLRFTEAEWNAFLLGMDAGAKCEFRIKRGG
jgi:hypothetical protein